TQSDITPIPGNSFTSTTASPSSIASSEPAIAVPTDSSDLRFASLPAPATRMDTAPLAGAGTPTITGTLPPRGAAPDATTFTTVAPLPAPQPVNSLTPGGAGPQVTLTPVANGTAPASTFREPAPSLPADGAGAPAPFPSEVPRIRLPNSS